LASVMVLLARLGSKLMVSGPALAAASAIACRRLPRPLSRVFDTVNVAGVVRFSRVSKETGRRRPGRWRDTNSRLSQELAIDGNSFSSKESIDAAWTGTRAGTWRDEDRRLFPRPITN